MGEKIKKQLTVQNFVEFIKLQLAGNVLFWGTYIGYFVFEQLLEWSHLSALITASLIAHILFFIVDKHWVFNADTGEEKTAGEVARFALFMGLNFFINIGIITGLDRYLDITPYIGQFIAALFFTFWTYFGLKFWVFSEAEHHSLIAKRNPHGQRKSRSQTK